MAAIGAYPIGLAPIGSSEGDYSPPSGFQPAWALDNNLVSIDNMIKNTAGQDVGAQIVTAADGTAFSGTVTVYVTGDGGTQAIGSVGSGVCTNEGNGYYSYAPSQAETNYDHIAFTFVGTGAIPVTIQLYAVTSDINVTHWGGTTVGSVTLPVNVTQISGDSTAADNAEAFFDGTGYAGTNNVIPLVTTVTDLTNLPTIPANWLTAAGLAIDAVAEIQSGLATASSLATVAGYLDTEIAAILADTNELQTDWANGGRLDLILDTAALGGSGGLDAAGVRAAIGLASANLDTQLATIDTNVDAVLVDTNQLQTDWANGGRLDLLLDNVLMVGIEYIHTNDTTAETANVTITKA